MAPKTKKLTAALVGTGRIGWLLEQDHLRGPKLRRLRL